jgi:MYXO-CTERM domain-containing protein
MTTMSPRSCLLTLCALLGSATLAHANDTAAGGSGTDIVPLQTAEVRMAAEDILITHEGIDWVVEAEYTFENLTKKPIKRQIAFPEYACEDRDPETNPYEMCDSKPLRYESMRTTVNGQPVPHRKGTIKAGHPWKPRLGLVWLFDATFAVGEPTRIHHSYRVHETEDSGGGRAIKYVTRTGATWAGKIGHARFRVRIPFEAYQIYLPEGSGLEVTQRAVDVEGKKVGEILLEAREWEPTTDLSFYYKDVRPGLMKADAVGERAPFADTPDPHCPQLSTILIRGGLIGEPNPNDPVDPENTVEKWADKLATQGLGEPEYCRGYIYAYRGKDLGSDKLNKYFYGPEGHKDHGWPYKLYKPNPYYSDALLTKGDLTTLQLIDAIAARVRKPAEQRATSPSSQSAPIAEARQGCGCSMPRSSVRTPALLALLVLALGVRSRRRR